MRYDNNQLGTVRPVDLFLIILLLVLFIIALIYFFRVVPGADSDAEQQIVREPYYQARTSHQVLTDQQYGISLLHPTTWRESDVMQSVVPETLESYILTDMTVEQESEREHQSIMRADHSISIDIVSSTAYSDIEFAQSTVTEQLSLNDDSIVEMRWWDQEAVLLYGLHEKRYYKIMIFTHPINANWIVVSAVSDSKSLKDSQSSAFSLITESLRYF